MSKTFVRYVLREHHCPKCGEKGSLFVFYISRKSGGWNGPYFVVKHTTTRHDPGKRLELKKRLGRCPCCGQLLVGKVSTKTYEGSWSPCYFGKCYPKPIDGPIPSPPISFYSHAATGKIRAAIYDGSKNPVWTSEEI